MTGALVRIRTPLGDFDARLEHGRLYWPVNYRVGVTLKSLKKRGVEIVTPDEDISPEHKRYIAPKLAARRKTMREAITKAADALATIYPEQEWFSSATIADATGMSDVIDARVVGGVLRGTPGWIGGSGLWRKVR